MNERTLNVDPAKIPNHIAIILDGNGRWAKKRGMPRLFGHREGAENLKRIVRAFLEFNIKYLTVYAFSTENWNRPQDEIAGLKQIFNEAFGSNLKRLSEEQIRIIHLGQREGLDADLLTKIDRAVEETKNNSRLTLSIGLNYGSRNEIMHAVRKIVSSGAKPEDISEQTITNALFTHELPDPDLVIRTSGEQRLSNFLLWQSAYAEWEFPKKLWPEFNREDLIDAIEEYASRDRRFGRISS
ncbi:MAG: isoprenyl transferase [Chloroflexi bacterium]|nr:isoprenyl transferase [Chloroflexota bacterium]